MSDDGFVIHWEGLSAWAVPLDQHVNPNLEPQKVFKGEKEALREMVGDLDAGIAEMRSSRRAAMTRLRQLERKRA